MEPLWTEERIKDIRGIWFDMGVIMASASIIVSIFSQPP